MLRPFITVFLGLSVAACGSLPKRPLDKISKPDQPILKEYADWPVADKSLYADLKIEQTVSVLLKKMTLDDKVGQMIQPELQQISPDEAAQYRIGSMLSAGESWPGKKKHASAADWVSLADQYWLALEKGYQGRGFRVPLLWATDAVHGHNNVYGATLYPHNIGLGAANDPDLVYRISRATAKEVLATGLDWTFSPTVAVPRDDRWGRTYEGYSEDPQRVYQYASKIVKGFQGKPAELKTDQRLLATVKHWVGDGGTEFGKDQGNNRYDEHLLRNLHASGYFSGLNAGAQAVMVSFNKWVHPNSSKADSASLAKPLPIHGSHYLITEVLKEKMGFDGVVISDWNGHETLKGCSVQSCAVAINAGIDIVMVTANKDWKAFRENLIKQASTGEIPMSRIDDAVSRILRMKLRAGMWNKSRPSKRTLAGNQALIGAAEHRLLAREAVRKSLVLLKNNGPVLPLAQDKKLLLAGSALEDIGKQTGGWSMTWQGTKNTQDDFPGSKTLKQAVTELVGQSKVVTDTKKLNGVDTAVVVIGERPYTEFFGDIKGKKTLQLSTLSDTHKKDLALIRSLKQKGLKVVTVLYSGRPLYINDYLNASDSVIAAWLPGTEADGISDVMFKDANGKVRYDFKGRLAYSWPGHPCSTTINRMPSHIKQFKLPAFEQALTGKNKPLFEYGYGLSYANKSNKELAVLPVNTMPQGCGKP